MRGTHHTAAAAAERIDKLGNFKWVECIGKYPI